MWTQSIYQVMTCVGKCDKFCYHKAASNKSIVRVDQKSGCFSVPMSLSLLPTFYFSTLSSSLPLSCLPSLPVSFLQSPLVSSLPSILLSCLFSLMLSCFPSPNFAILILCPPFLIPFLFNTLTIS